MTQSSPSLKKLRRSLDHWREQGRPSRRIPETIWEDAVVAAAQHGVGPVAKSLGLDHAKLKSKLAQKSTLIAFPVSEPTVPATFFEFLAPVQLPGSLDRCTFSVTSSRGAQLRVEVGGLDLPGLVTLVREFAS